MEKDKKNKINEEELEKVSGGGLFSPYTDSTFNEAGVEIVGAGNFYNDGYRFNGKDISDEEAKCLVEFYFAKKRIANSVQEAVDYMKELEKENRDHYIPL